MYNRIKKNPKKLQEYASKIIPGVSQLFGKRPELYLPGGRWPTYYSKAKGIEVWSIDNKKYLDFTMVGIGTSVLGYSDPTINKAATKVIKGSSMNTLNPPEDVELAEMLIKIHPWAESVRYCRTGGESMSIAIRLARAYTGKDKVLFSGYHGWHDWYLSTNLKSGKNLNTHLLPGLTPIGVPKVLKDTVVPFKFNDFKELETKVKKLSKNCAAIVLEPCREELPKPGYLEKLKFIAKQNKCVLIFDEITSGWRLGTSGIHMQLGVYPDIAIFGKTIANGYAMGAIIGKKKIMKFSTKTFISSAFWTERIGPACAVAFIKKHKKLNLGKLLVDKGTIIKNIWKSAAETSGMKIKISGIDPLASFKLEVKNWRAALTFFIQEMLKKGILASDRCYSNYKHDKKSLKLYEQACFQIFKEIAILDKKNKLVKNVKGPLKAIDFGRVNKVF